MQLAAAEAQKPNRTTQDRKSGGPGKAVTAGHTCFIAPVPAEHMNDPPTTVCLSPGLI